MRWRWVLGVGAGVAALAFTLIYLTVTLYAAALSVLSRGELDRAALDAALDRFADFMVAWGLPGLYLLLMVSGVSWLARRTLETNVWQGVTVGLVSATLLQVIGLAFGPPSLRELILYPLLGMAGGYLGGVVGRALLAEHEALYRTSRDIGAAANAQEVGAAIGRNLADAEQVSLWTMTPRTGDSGSLELELLGSWASRAGEVWPNDRRLDATKMPALADLRRQSPREVWRRELRPRERKEWERCGIGCALLVPLDIPGPDGLLVVASRKSRRFSWGRVRTYQTAGAQAALALENIRLVEKARQSGELEERRRLAGEIHDTLIQGFASIAMNLEAAEGSLGNGSVAAWRHLDEARRTARENLVEARRIVWALGPEALEEAPLHEALARLAQRWSEGSEVFAGVRVTGEPRPLLAEIEVTLMRASQEALTNVRKHARASRVVLTLSYMEDRVALDIKDDGVGFEAGNGGRIPLALTGGFGLRAMRERAERSGGTLLIESEPGSGTTLAVELPLRGRRRDESREGFDRRRPSRGEDGIMGHARRTAGLRSSRGGTERRGGHGDDGAAKPRRRPHGPQDA